MNYLLDSKRYGNFYPKKSSALIMRVTGCFQLGLYSAATVFFPLLFLIVTLTLWQMLLFEPFLSRKMF